VSPLDTWVATWTILCTERHKLRVFENGILRKIFGLKREELRMSRFVPLYPLCSCMACYPETSALRGSKLQEIGESFMMRSFMKLFYDKHYSGGRSVRPLGKCDWKKLVSLSRNQIDALSIIRSLFTVHSAMVYVIQVCRQLSSRSICSCSCSSWFYYANKLWSNFTFMWPCIVTNFFVTKSTRCTNFTNSFRNETLHISDSSSVHHQEFIHCTLSNGICHTGL
jgi:hypothetical protein